MCCGSKRARRAAVLAALFAEPSSAASSNQGVVVKLPEVDSEKPFPAPHLAINYKADKDQVDSIPTSTTGDIETKSLDRAPPSYHAALRGDGPVDMPRKIYTDLANPIVAYSTVSTVPDHTIIQQRTDGDHEPKLHIAHPECISSGHTYRKKYGAAGIVAGIVFFPWGLFWAACDSHLQCQRCGDRIPANKCGERKLRRWEERYQYLQQQQQPDQGACGQHSRFQRPSHRQRRCGTAGRGCKA